MTLLDLSTLTLTKGLHYTREEGMCTMEAVAWLAGEPHSDHPKCACPVMAAFVRSLQDNMPDDKTRTRHLLPLVPRFVGSLATREVEQWRVYALVDWAVRSCAASALEHGGLKAESERLHSLPEVVDAVTARAAARAASAAATRAVDAAHAAADARVARAAVSAAYSAYYAADAAAEAVDSAANAAASNAAADAAITNAAIWTDSVAMIEKLLAIR